MEYKTITKPNGSEQKLAVYDGKCALMEGLYDSLPDTAEKRAEECKSAGQDRPPGGRHGQRRHAVARTVGDRLRQAGNHGGRLLKLSGTGVQPAG